VIIFSLATVSQCSVGGLENEFTSSEKAKKAKQAFPVLQVGYIFSNFVDCFFSNKIVI